MNHREIYVGVCLLATSEGGRTGPMLSGYRSLLRFEGTEEDFGFQLELGSGARTPGLAPGESGDAKVSFWAVEELPVLFTGQKFEIREGARVVGYGSIVET